MTPKNATTNARSTHCIMGRLIKTRELLTGFASVTEVVVGCGGLEPLKSGLFRRARDARCPGKLSNEAVKCRKCDAVQQRTHNM
jgi:hypothetical protein